MILSRAFILLFSQQELYLYSLSFYFSFYAFVSHKTTFYYLLLA